MAKDYIRFTGKVSFVEKKGATHARAVYRDSENNKKQVWRKVTGKKSDAKNAVIEEIEKILNKPPDEKPKEKTFADLAEYYRTAHAVPARFVEDVRIEGKKTWQRMRGDIGQLEDFFGEILLKDITRDKIQEYKIKTLDRKVRRIDRETKKPYFVPMALSTVNHHLRTLRAMMNVALENDWIPKLPNFKGLISAAAENKREVIPTEIEFLKILQATETRQRLYHVKPFVLLIADCGARPVEAFQLLWSDVDFENETVVLTSDKGKRRTKRTIGLTERLKGELLKLPRLNEYVFAGIKSIKSAWNSIQKLSGVYLDLYSLRHLFNSRLVALGYGYEERLKLMGQTVFSTNMRYTHLTENTVSEVAEALNKNPYLPVQEAEAVQ